MKGLEILCDLTTDRVSSTRHPDTFPIYTGDESSITTQTESGSRTLVTESRDLFRLLLRVSDWPFGPVQDGVGLDT